MTEKIHDIISKLESTKGAFKSRAVMEAREELSDLLTDPDYNPAEIAAAVDAIGAEMTDVLTVEEAHLMCDLLNGTFMDPRQVRTWPCSLELSVVDGCKIDGLDEKWSVDGKALAVKVATMPPYQAWWLVHQVRVWWRDGNGKPIDEDVTRRIFRIPAGKKQ